MMSFSRVAAHGIRTYFAFASAVAGLIGVTPGAVSAALWTVPDDAPTIQAAVDASAAGDTILLQPGTYRGVGNRDIRFWGKDLVLTSVAGPEQTTIDCEHLGRGFYLQDSETRDACIGGITICNGEASAYPNLEGGGILCSVSSPTIRDCWIRGCNAFHGGGICLGSSGALVERCWIADNWGEQQGGGIWVGFTFQGAASVADCVITGNWSMYGGGVFLESGASGLTGCTVAGNVGSYGGGAETHGSVVLDRCIFYANCTWIHGRELWIDEAEFRCCLVDPTGVEGVHVATYDEYCISGDPLFCAGDGCGQYFGGDWTLQADSPCAPEQSPCGQLIGALGIGCGGALPTGACCFVDGSCLVETAAECVGQNGNYEGDSVPCDPNPCVPTPVEKTTWGRIKARFHEAGGAVR